MFVTVRFGNDQRQIFNPDCAVVNLLTDIKRRCFVGMSQDIDLTDETGLLMGISKAKPMEKALKYLANCDTYILVEKRETVTNASVSSEQTTPRGRLTKGDKAGRQNNNHRKDHYFPLLLSVDKIYPDYYFHRNKNEAKVARKSFRERRSNVSSDSAVGFQRKFITTPQRLKRVSDPIGSLPSFQTKKNHSVRRKTLVT